MNKLKLEVIRFNNEDVIATSGVCSYLDVSSTASNFGYAGHVRVSNLNAEAGDTVGYAYEYVSAVGKLQSIDTPISGSLYVNYSSLFATKEEGWYHWDKDSSKYVKCDETCDHPIEIR